MKLKRNLLLALLIMLVPLSSFAQRKWKVNAVPNTRLESTEIHISDPDDLISEGCETKINDVLCSIQDKADVFVVALGSIGDATPEKFASLLFEKWNIGDTITNNGALLFLVKDYHRTCLEVGSGIEGVLTEAVRSSIIQDAIKPYFIKDDMDKAISMGVAQIVGEFGGTIPEGFSVLLPKSTETVPEPKSESPEESVSQPKTESQTETAPQPKSESTSEPVSETTSESSSDSTEAEVGPVLIFLAIFNALFVIALISLIKNKGKRTALKNNRVKGESQDGQQQSDNSETTWSGNAWEGRGCFRAILVVGSLILWITIAMGVVPINSSGYIILLWGLVFYLTWICLRHNLKTLIFAKNLAEYSGNPSSVYKAAYNYPLTKITLFSAIWIGWIFLIIYKSKIKTKGEEKSH